MKLIFQWAERHKAAHPFLDLLFHIPNEGVRGSKTGIKRGIPDLFLPYNGGLFIELKRVKGGRVSEDQERVIKMLRLFGFRAEVCKGAREAVTLIMEHCGI